MKIKGIILFCVFSVIIIIGTAFILLNMKGKSGEMENLRVLNAQETLLQGMQKTAMGYAWQTAADQGRQGKQSSFYLEYNQLKKIFVQNLVALERGGAYFLEPVLSGQGMLKAAEDPLTQEKLEEASARFKSYGVAVEALFGEEREAKRIERRIQAVSLSADELNKTLNELVLAGTEHSQASTEALVRLILIVAGIFVFFLFVLFFLLIAGFSLPISRVVKRINRMNEGDLDSRLLLTRHDEIGQIAQALDRLCETLNGIIGGIIGNADTSNSLLDGLSTASKKIDDSTQEMKSVAHTIASSSEEIANNMNTVAAASEEASSNVTSITAMVEELSVNTDTIASAAEEASINMGGVSDNVGKISKDIDGIVAKSVEELSQSLSNINDSTSQAMAISEEANRNAVETLKSMKELGEATRQIDQILKMVNNIASQTNMLALNATIEAASAGQAGKGFAVVANEVKELAKQTTSANSEIAIQVDQIQEYVSKSLSDTNKVSKVIMEVTQINQGIASLVGRQNANAAKLVEAVESVANAAKDSAINVEEAAMGIKEVTRSTAEVSAGAKDSAKNVSEAATGVKEIARSSAEIAQGVQSINVSIQSIYSSTNNVSSAISDNLKNIGLFAEMSSALKKTVDFFVKGGSTFFYWNDMLSVSHDGIDQQHKMIVHYINELYSAKKNNKGLSEVKRLLDSLIKVSVDHFNAEEKIFEITDYPDTENHKAAHKKLVAQLGEFQEKFARGEANVDDALFDFLKDWLQKHILVIDKGYSRFLKS